MESQDEPCLRGNDGAEKTKVGDYQEVPMVVAKFMLVTADSVSTLELLRGDA